MNETDLFRNWIDQKISHNYMRLASQNTVAYEFVGQRGHPSSYANVKFIAEPADALEVTFDVSWPLSFSETYRLRVESSIAEAVLDGLIGGAATKRYRGVSVKLVGFGWDEVGGSELAVYRATMRAMEQLRENCEWTLVGGRSRSYT